MYRIPGAACDGFIWHALDLDASWSDRSHDVRLPGFCGEPPAPGPAPMLDAVRDALLPRVAGSVVMAHSLGAFIAYQLAARVDLAALIIIDGAPALGPLMGIERAEAQRRADVFSPCRRHVVSAAARCGVLGHGARSRHGARARRAWRAQRSICARRCDVHAVDDRPARDVKKKSRHRHWCCCRIRPDSRHLLATSNKCEPFQITKRSSSKTAGTSSCSTNRAPSPLVCARFSHRQMQTCSDMFFDQGKGAFFL